MDDLASYYQYSISISIYSAGLLRTFRNTSLLEDYMQSLCNLYVDYLQTTLSLCVVSNVTSHKKKITIFLGL